MFKGLGSGKSKGEIGKPSPIQAAALNVPSAEPRQATIRFVDRADCEETFADSVHNVVYDGQTLRIEFAVTRLDEIKPGAPLTGRRYPACRLVLPSNTAADLISKLQQIAAGMAQAGMAKGGARPAKIP